MKALWMIARHEVVRAMRHRTVRGGTWLLGALLLTACLLGAYRHGAQARERQAWQELVRHQWEEQPDRHPHRVAHYGSFALRPSDPLGFFDPGVDDFTGTLVFLEAHRRNSATFSQAEQSSELVRFGVATAASVLQLLLPLIIFCLGYASVAGEREQGTWALLLSQGVGARTVLAGKVLGLVLVVAWMLAPPLVLALVAVPLLGSREGLAEVGVRLPLLAASYGLYVVVCAAAAVLVSSWHRRTSSALLSLLALWMGLWVVVPRAATQVAGWLHPAPSRATFERTLEAALRSAGDSHQPTSPAFIELKERLLREHGVERVEELPFNFGGVVMREGEAATSQVMNEHHERLYAAFHAQDRLALLLSALNPMLALRSWSMALAGTDSHHAASFQRQAEAHRYGFIQRLNALHTHEIRWQNDRAQRLDARRWKEFPPFHYERPALGWALGNVTLAGAALVGWAAVLLGMLLVGRRGGLA